MRHYPGYWMRWPTYLKWNLSLGLWDYRKAPEYLLPPRERKWPLTTGEQDARSKK